MSLHPDDPAWLDRIISLKETAELQGISIDTLKRKAARGEGPRILQLSPRRRGCRLREVLAERSEAVS